jgi:hypothetical protein
VDRRTDTIAALVSLQTGAHQLQRYSRQMAWRAKRHALQVASVGQNQRSNLGSSDQLALT